MKVLIKLFCLICKLTSVGKVNNYSKSIEFKLHTQRQLKPVGDSHAKVASFKRDIE